MSKSKGVIVIWSGPGLYSLDLNNLASKITPESKLEHTSIYTNTAYLSCKPNIGQFFLANNNLEIKIVITAE